MPTDIAVATASIFNAVRDKKDNSKMYIYFFTLPNGVEATLL